MTGSERARLRATFGCLLAWERDVRSLTQRDLAVVCGVGVRTVKGLEVGDRRPSVSMCWRLARGLRIGFDEYAVGAVAVRLEVAAGESLRDYSRRPHVARDRLRAVLLEESGGRPPIRNEGDSLHVVTLMSMIERMG